MDKLNEAKVKIDIPMLTDTEAETSIEQDAEELVRTKASLATSNATKSLFNITFDDFDEKKLQQSVELKIYEAKLDQELKDWKLLLRDAYNDLKKSKEKHPTVDKSILPPAKRKYLEKAPCLHSFIRESVAFREEAHIFLKLDYAETMEALENLLSVCRHRIECRKALAITENLANIRRK